MKGLIDLEMTLGLVLASRVLNHDDYMTRCVL